MSSKIIKIGNTSIEVNSVEQSNLWSYVRRLYPNISRIQPVYFQGLIAGSEFLTYNANKIYICLDEAYLSNQSVLSGNYTVTHYDQLNNSLGAESFQIPIWNTTLADYRYVYVTLKNKNIYFSRISATNYTYMKFNGFRLTI